jgi:hypothetical protein
MAEERGDPSGAAAPEGAEEQRSASGGASPRRKQRVLPRNPESSRPTPRKSRKRGRTRITKAAKEKQAKAARSAKRRARAAATSPIANSDNLPERNPPGRPAWLVDDEIREQIEAGAGLGLTNQQIAYLLGISLSTFYEHRAEFSEALERGRANATSHVRKALYDGAVSGSIGHIQLYEQVVNNWTPRQAREHSGPSGGPIPVAVLPDDEIVSRMRTLRERAQAVVASPAVRALSSGGQSGHDATAPAESGMAGVT